MEDDNMSEETIFGTIRISGDTAITLLKDIEDSFTIWKQDGKKYKAVFFLTTSGEIKIKGKLIEEKPEIPPEPPKEEPIEEKAELPPAKRKYRKRKNKPIKATAEAISKKTYKSKGKYSTEELKSKIIKVLQKGNGINCTTIAKEIFGPNTMGNQRDGTRVKKMCKELADEDKITQEGGGKGRSIINTLIDSKISDSEVKKDLPKPTGETFMDRDEIADKIMDSMLDTPHRTRRELFSIVFGTTHPNSKDVKALKKSLDILLKYGVIAENSSGDEFTWCLTNEGEEIAKNKRIKKEAKV